MAHQVHIGSMVTACQFKVAPARKELLRQAVDRACRERLEGALRQALFPILEGRNGIVRIRRLDLNLTATNPLAHDLVHVIAGRIAALVRARLQQGRDEIQLWPDQGQFIAHYVLWRLGLRAGAEWAFADFKALQHLSPQQAVIEVLIARPQAIVALALESIMRGASYAFARALDPQMCVALLTRLSDAPEAQDLGKVHDVWKAQADIFSGVLPEIISDPLARSALVLLLRMLVSLPDKPAAQVPQIALLARVLVALTGLPPVTLITKSVPWKARLSAMQGKTIPAASLTLLINITDRQGGGAVLDSLAAAVAEHLKNSNGQDKLAPNASAKRSNQNPAPQSATTQAAGVALLMPAFAQLSAKFSLTDAHRHAISLATLPTELQPVAARSAGFLDLFPRNPQMPEPKDWPKPDLTGLPQHFLTASGGRDLWAQAVMAQFVTRLPGLQGSSIRYLQDQFLTCTGDVLVTKSDLLVTLHRVPLGIVLSMGGHLGCRGCVPWRDDRALNICIKGGV